MNKKGDTQAQINACLSCPTFECNPRDKKCKLPKDKNRSKYMKKWYAKKKQCVSL